MGQVRSCGSVAVVAGLAAVILAGCTSASGQQPAVPQQTTDCVSVNNCEAHDNGDGTYTDGQGRVHPYGEVHKLETSTIPNAPVRPRSPTPNLPRRNAPSTSVYASPNACPPTTTTTTGRSGNGSGRGYPNGDGGGYPNGDGGGYPNGCAR